jgi:adenosylcobinamide-GDP ribazoletransferase
VKSHGIRGFLREVLGGFVTAVRTLTLLPCPGPEACQMANALPWLPVVGLILGLAVAGVQQVVMQVTAEWAAGSAAVGLAISCWLTRGMHLDGLSDCADGFGGGRTREKTLAIMKDPCAGAFGVITLVCVLLLKWTSMQRLLEQGQAWWVIVPFALSRTAQVVLATTQPYARAEGGTGAPFVNGAGGWHLAVAVVLGLTASVLVPGSWQSWASAVVVAAGVTLGFGLRCRHRLGGVTGDCLGAVSELVETSVLLLGASFCG